MARPTRAVANVRWDCCPDPFGTRCGSSCSGVMAACPLTSGRTASQQVGPPSVVRRDDSLYIGHMALKRMDNVGIVVDDLAAALDFFRDLGLELEGRAT